jgi:transcriptional regulator with XRE-family HTH domain
LLKEVTLGGHSLDVRRSERLRGDPELDGAGVPGAGGVKPQPTLGRRLKALRVSRGLSLKDVAGDTGLSTSFLSMVETGRNEMTVGRLVSLASFYKVGLDDLLHDRGFGQPVVLREGDREILDSRDPGVRTELLGSWHYGDLTSGILHFEVGADRRSTTSYAGPEFVLVLSGELSIEFSDGVTALLQEGDSVWFEASRRHRKVNTGDTEARILTFTGKTSATNV